MEVSLAAKKATYTTRVPNVKHPSDRRGWVTHRVSIYTQNKEAGYLSVSYVPLSTYKNTLADRTVFCKTICGILNPTSFDLERVEGRHKSFKQFHVDTAHVAYVHVEPEFRRQGLGRQLYVEAAKWMGELGLALAASDTQTVSAMKLWKSLTQDPDLPTGQTAGGRATLDFRPL